MPTNSYCNTFFVVFLHLVFIFPLFMETFNLQRSLIHVPLTKTWFEAREYCREHHTDLADLTSKIHLWHDTDWVDIQDSLIKEVPLLMCHILTGCWIGLYKDNDQVWWWSNGKEMQYPEDINEGSFDSSSCGGFEGQSLFTDQCNETNTFLCEERLILVKEKKTWEQALEHCMALGNEPELTNITVNPHYSLAYVEIGGVDSEAREAVLDAETDEVWIGLRFLAGYWLWMNRNSPQEQLPVCPQPGKYCGAMSKTGQLLPENDCLERRNFLCSEIHINEIHAQFGKQETIY